MRIVKVTFYLLVLAWCVGYFRFIYISQNYTLENKTTTDTIVVFGGNAQRLYTGAKLVKFGYAPYIFVTGNKPSEEYMPFLKEQNLSPDRFIYDVKYAGSNHDYGLETALFLRRYNFSSARLVSPSYQISRAMIELNANLPLNISVIAHPVSLKHKNYTLLFIEYNKYVLMFVANILGIAHEINLSYS